MKSYQIRLPVDFCIIKLLPLFLTKFFVIVVRALLGLKILQILIQKLCRPPQIFTIFFYLCLLTTQDHYFEKSVQVLYFITSLKTRDYIVGSLKKTHFGDSCSDDLFKKKKKDKNNSKWT